MSSQADLRSLFQALEIDIDSFHWEELAACLGAPTNWFFDLYENNKAQAKQIDNMCLACPIIKQCFEQGRSNKETGVWGGFYLTYGAIDKSKNAHKSPDIIHKLAGLIYD